MVVVAGSGTGVAVGTGEGEGEGEATGAETGRGILFQRAAAAYSITLNNKSIAKTALFFLLLLFLALLPFLAECAFCVDVSLGWGEFV